MVMIVSLIYIGDNINLPVQRAHGQFMPQSR